MFKITILLAVTYIHIVTSGYISKVLSAADCKDPDPAYAPKRFIDCYIELVHKENRTFIVGNLTNHENCYNCKWLVSVVRQVKGVKRLILRFKDMSCKDLLVQVMHRVSGIPVDSKTCRTKPDTYQIKEFDINNVEKTMQFPFRNNGIYYYTFGINTAEGTQVCWEIKAKVTMTKNSKNVWI